MVHRTYYGLGTREAAVRAFEDLAPHVVMLFGMRAECAWGDVDYDALGVALEGLQTAAFHFTRQPHFYHRLELERPFSAESNGRLRDRNEAIAAFEELRPYADRLGKMQGQCRPFGRDYLALDIARQSLRTAAFHFTRDAHFYGAKFDSAGPLAPSR